jgi:hypothetical protein
MPTATWSRILNDVNRLSLVDQQQPPQPGIPNHVDQYRRAKISAVEQITGRPLILYISACTSPGKLVQPEMLMLDASDKIGFKTATENIPSPNLDVMVHSPGGVPDATEAIVQQLRGKYSHIRFIVPAYAKSAATMLVMSGNEILMDPDAELGPIDPQVRTQNGFSPAEAILEQFKKAQEEIRADASKLASWVPILALFGPSLLVDCQHFIDLSKNLVKTWVQTWMLSGDPEASTKASAISDYLGAHSTFKSHGRAVKIPDLIPLGVKVTDIKTNPALHSAITELYCCLDILLGNSPVYKIFENSSGDALVRQSGMIQPPIFIPQRMPIPMPRQPRPGQ